MNYSRSFILILYSHRNSIRPQMDNEMFDRIVRTAKHV